MKIAILLGTSEYIVFDAAASISELIREQWNMDIMSTINRKYQYEITTISGYTIIVKPLTLS